MYPLDNEYGGGIRIGQLSIMAHKKYYGYKKPHEYYEVTFWADNGKEGTALYSTSSMKMEDAT